MTARIKVELGEGGVPVHGAGPQLQAHGRCLHEGALEVVHDGEHHVGAGADPRRGEQPQRLELAHREGGDHHRIAHLAHHGVDVGQVQRHRVRHREPALERVEQLLGHAVQREERIGLRENGVVIGHPGNLPPGPRGTASSIASRAVSVAVVPLDRWRARALSVPPRRIATSP